MAGFGPLALYHAILFLSLFAFKGIFATPTSAKDVLVARAGLSCPGSNGARYTTGGKTFVVACGMSKQESIRSETNIGKICTTWELI